MAKYPIYLELQDRRVVVIGGGAVAARKARVLLDCGARLVLVADKIDDAVVRATTGRNAELIRSKYSKNYLAEAVLAIAATNNHKLNERIYRDCQELEVLCNVVDVPDLCDFYVPATVRRGPLQIAIGTEGYCPAYSGHLRKKLEHMFTEDHGRFLLELECIRKRIINEIDDATVRKVILGELVDDESFEFFKRNGSDAWHARAEEIISRHKAQV